MDEARPESLQQLALPEHVGHLVAHPPPRLAAARRGRAESQQADEERGAAREQQPADRDCCGERDRGECRGGPAYVSLAFRIAALIAGTTVCRSPITA